MFHRRHFLKSSIGAGALVGLASNLPAWAMPSHRGNMGIPSLHGTKFDLNIDRFPVSVNGRTGNAIGVNGTMPAPLIRFQEGDDIEINVTNNLKVDTSIHWHGLLVPFYMDGVPGVSFPGIPSGETFQYKFSVPQNGTYWYHSHSGLQEQAGHYGPLIIDPKGTDPVKYDREYVMVISDWSFLDPNHIFAKLKKMGESFNYAQLTFAEKRRKKLHPMWDQMRMSPRDIADVTGATYTYLINGHGTEDNWNAIFVPGERVRLRIVNASAMSIFNIRIPGLPMTIVQSDGLNVQPLEIDEFQMGVAETYDVIVEPNDNRAYAFVAESIDRSGQVVATLAPTKDARATAPALREVPTLKMIDMGMSEHDMGHEMEGGHGMSSPTHTMPDGTVMSGASHDGHDMSSDKMSGPTHTMPDGTVMSGASHAGHDMNMMDHSQHDMSPKPEPASMDHSMHDMSDADAPMVERGPGVANIAMNPVSRLHEPGIGLENVPHRTLNYADLRSLEPNPDTRAPEREIELHLTSNMERYMWSFNGVKFNHVKESIKLYEGERIRFVLINDTMMPHPIHLHGMFFDLVNGGGTHKPRKHTVIVKPGEKLAYDVTADAVGDWAFHCHLLYHMHAGMMQVVSVMPSSEIKPSHMDHQQMDHSEMGHGSMKHDQMDHGKMDHEMPLEQKPKPDHSNMDHSNMDHSKMGHGG
ncbi:MAG: copper resistance system multicopper oxidase [Hyphomonadaceae bacterium]|nr:copper resistance system multicopper oxidase [Hyphomonadaceae bacterium]